MLSRRKFLFGVLALGGVGGFAIARGGVTKWLQHEITNHFGVNAASNEAAQAFLQDFLDAGSADKGDVQPKPLVFARRRFLGHLSYNERQIRDEMIRQFVTATNIIRHQEAGVEFDYFGLADPYENACLNQLTAYALELS